MTGASDGDVDRALAAIGATPLKYHSFGGVSVRPPGAEAPLHEPRASGAASLPPTGEGTAERYRARAAATVFPLLGLALPEAFQIDVEPVWPVGPPVSDQGVLLDRAVGGQPGAANAGYHAPYSPAPYGAAAHGYSANNEATPAAFSMPPWLDPLPPANPLHDLPDLPPPAPYIGATTHQNDVFHHDNPAHTYHSAATGGEDFHPPAAPPPDMFPVRRLNTWGEEPVNNDRLHDEYPTAAGPAPHEPFNPFVHVGSKPAPPTEPSWLDQGGPAGHEAPPAVNDWTMSHDANGASPRAHFEPEMPEPEMPPYAVPDWPMPDLNKSADIEPYEPPGHAAKPEHTGFLDAYNEAPHIQTVEPPSFDHHMPEAELSRPDPEHVPYETRSEIEPPALHLREAFPPEEFDPYAPSRFQPIDAEPTWHEPPAPVRHEEHDLAHPPLEPAQLETAQLETASFAGHDVVPPHPVADPAPEFGAAAKHRPGSATPPVAHRRPLADMFRTLGGGGANS